MHKTSWRNAGALAYVGMVISERARQWIAGQRPDVPIRVWHRLNDFLREARISCEGEPCRTRSRDIAFFQAQEVERRMSRHDRDLKPIVLREVLERCERGLAALKSNPRSECADDVRALEAFSQTLARVANEYLPLEPPCTIEI